MNHQLALGILKFHVITICSGRTDWGPIRSVTVRVINKIGQPRAGGVQFIICLITRMITNYM